MNGARAIIRALETHAMKNKRTIKIERALRKAGLAVQYDVPGEGFQLLDVKGNVIEKSTFDLRTTKGKALAALVGAMELVTTAEAAA